MIVAIVDIGMKRAL